MTGASAMALASARRCDALRPAAAASGAQLLQPNYLFEGVRRSKGRSGVSRGLSTIAITDIERLLPLIVIYD